MALALPAFACGAIKDELSPERLGVYAEPVARAMAKPTVHYVVGPIESPLPMDVAQFLLDHPDLSAWIVRRHRIAPYIIEMKGPNHSWADDRDGTTGFIDLADKRPNGRVYYTEGTHVSGIFPDIHAAAVILMDIRSAPRPGCPERIATSFEVYLRMRSAFLSAMVKILRPFIRGILIRKFSKAFSSAEQVGILLAKDPDAVRQEILDYPGLSMDDRAVAQRLLGPLMPVAPACR